VENHFCDNLDFGTGAATSTFRAREDRDLSRLKVRYHLTVRQGFTGSLALVATRVRCSMPLPRQFESLRHLVSNTPMLAIHVHSGGARSVVYAKAEHFNLTGSIKDRMAYGVLRAAYDRGELLPGMRIVEATSGNTGISFAAIGRSLGHQVTICMPDWMSRERVDLIRAFGAEIRHVSAEEGGFLGAIRITEEMAASDPGVFLPRQFANEDNTRAHEETTGPEIWEQLRLAGREPDAFVAGVGTGGTVMGVGRLLRLHDPRVRVHPLEPAESPTLSAGRKVGRHRIQGISDEFIPPVVDLSSLDAVVAVHDGDAILMAQKLASQLGLAVGISSGANFLGALKVLRDLGPEAAVVTVFPDSNKKYLSTDLLREEPVRDGYLTPDIALEGYETIPRVCILCPSVNQVLRHLPGTMVA
jgi:cysteine synthase A